MPVVVEDIELTVDSHNGVNPVDVGNNTYRIDLDESGKARIPDTWPIASFHRTFIKTPVGRMTQLDDFRIVDSNRQMARKSEPTANGVRSWSVKDGSKYRMRVNWLNPVAKSQLAVDDVDDVPPVCRIDVTGHGVSIFDGDAKPGAVDDTDFGTVPVATLASRPFTVKNTGTETLYLGLPSVKGAGFWRGAKSLAKFLEPGESDTFHVKFTSPSTGTFSGEVIMYHSAVGEAPYNFAITATVVDPASPDPPTHLEAMPSP
jgi:hypothetical protein